MRSWLERRRRWMAERQPVPLREKARLPLMAGCGLRLRCVAGYEL